MGKIISDHWQDGNVAVRGIGNLARLGNVLLLEKAFSDSIRRGFLVPYQKKSRFLITFSNSIKSGLSDHRY